MANPIQIPIPNPNRVHPSPSLGLPNLYRPNRLGRQPIRHDLRRSLRHENR